MSLTAPAFSTGIRVQAACIEDHWHTLGLCRPAGNCWRASLSGEPESPG